MIPQIKRILCAMDLSDNSSYVLRYVMNSAKKHDAGIIILFVLEPLPTIVNGVTQAYLTEGQVNKIAEERLAYVKYRIKKQLKIVCEKELENDPYCADRVESIELCEGFPAEMILRKADELNCDAIALGTHGKGFIRDTFLGSTSKRVLRRTRKPVFIIPLPKEEADIGLSDAD